jgi:hypothetical protein
MSMENMEEMIKKIKVEEMEMELSKPAICDGGINAIYLYYEKEDGKYERILLNNNGDYDVKIKNEIVRMMILKMKEMCKEYCVNTLLSSKRFF